MNMVELQKSIRSLLLTKTSRVYLDKAPPSAVYPYVVCGYPSSFVSDPGERVSLEIDVWDKSDDTILADNLVDSIIGDGSTNNPTGINRKSIYSSGTVAATAYFDSRQTVVDEDERIVRRQVRFILQCY